MHPLTDELGSTLNQLSDLAERALALVSALRANAGPVGQQPDGHDALARLVDELGSMDSARELARTYLYALPDRVERLIEAFVTGDELTAVRLAGDLDVASGMVGADAMRRGCRDAITSRSADPAGLRATCRATEHWLRDWLTST